MDNNCCASTHKEPSRSQQTVVCSSCEAKGKKVSLQTLKACLSVSLEVLNDTEETFFFCRSEHCPIVYFGTKGTLFTEEHLRELVYQKHPDEDETLVCYCYQHTRGSIQADLIEHGKTDVVERVTAGTKAGSCACEIRNPQGSCCLGNIRAVVKRIEENLSPSSSQS